MREGDRCVVRIQNEHWKEAIEKSKVD